MSEATLLAMAVGDAFRDYALLTGATILFFDHLLTMADEIDFVWRKPKRLSFFIFVALRHVSLLSNIGMLVLRYVPMSLESCDASSLSQITLLILQCFIVGTMLGLRVYAMYNFSKIVLLFLIREVVQSRTEPHGAFGRCAKPHGIYVPCE
ncbi:hypothetical protein C8R45DRAFT_1031949 [Mycena sanguinolenta]|nr:hypothetical protein C8R45DRAFT_1031949 [Mycena sanguinolenta]